jgi:hypothetical protein
MGLDQAVVLAVKDCQRNGVKAIARNVLPRLPGTFTYNEKYFYELLNALVQRGALVKLPGRKGYATATSICPCCGSLTYHLN